MKPLYEFQGRNIVGQYVWHSVRIVDVETAKRTPLVVVRSPQELWTES